MSIKFYRLFRAVAASVAAPVLIIGIQPYAVAQSELDARSSQAQITLNALNCVRQHLQVGFYEKIPFGVMGTYYAQSPVVFAENLELSNDSTLFFARSPTQRTRINPQCEDTFFVVANSVRVSGEGNATITWDKAAGIERVPLDRGQAPAGADGAAPGQHGLNGTEGAPGNKGFSGRSAPTLFILVSRFLEGRLVIDFEGENGGTGGVGQTGGDGGAGHPGSPASQTMFYCKRGPGPGGDGGDGGRGGLGGSGGDGGDGGTVFLVTGINNVDKAIASISVNLSGGTPGVGGGGGRGGRGGSPGLEGQNSLPFCQPAGRDGQAGQPGIDGENGSEGRKGLSGTFYVLPLLDEQLREQVGGYFDQ